MKRLAQICIERPVFATVLILSLVVVGLAAYNTLGVDRFPKIDFPSVVITTTLVGAGAPEVLARTGSGNTNAFLVAIALLACGVLALGGSRRMTHR